MSVVGLDAGGARDIVRDGVDGALLPTASVRELRDAVQKVADSNWDSDALVERARMFSEERFAERFGGFVAGLADAGGR